MPAPGWLVHRSQPFRAETNEREVPVAPTHGPPSLCHVRPPSVVRITGPIPLSPGRDRAANPTSCAPKDGSTRYLLLGCHVRPPSWLCSNWAGHGEGERVPQVPSGSMAAQASRVPRTTLTDRTEGPRHLVVQLRPPSLVTAIAPLQKYARPVQVPQSMSAASPRRASQNEIDVGTGAGAVACAAPPAVARIKKSQIPSRLQSGQRTRRNRLASRLGSARQSGHRAVLMSPIPSRRLIGRETRRGSPGGSSRPVTR
jgi:hypothetical protein